MKKPRKPVDPLGPIDSIVALLSRLIVAGTLLTAATVLLSGGDHELEPFTTRDVCVEVPQSAVGTISGKEVRRSAYRQLHDNISVWPSEYRLCDRSPSVGDRWISALVSTPGVVYLAGFLVLMTVLLRKARRNGLFTAEVAHWTWVTGCWVLLGAVLTALSDALGRTWLARHFVDGVPWSQMLGNLDLSWAALIAGCGMLSVGHILATAVRMHDEIETLV